MDNILKDVKGKLAPAHNRIKLITSRKRISMGFLKAGYITNCSHIDKP